jgi:hypothetical protein
VPGLPRHAGHDAQAMGERGEEHTICPAQPQRSGLLALEQAELLPEQGDLQVLGALTVVAGREQVDYAGLSTAARVKQIGEPSTWHDQLARHGNSLHNVTLLASGFLRRSRTWRHGAFLWCNAANSDARKSRGLCGSGTQAADDARGCASESGAAKLRR